jgi:CheY-like chemotaxis protein
MGNTILIVMSDPVEQQGLLDYLSRRHYDVLPVEDGFSVLEMADKFVPAAFFLDSVQAGLSALEVSRILRERPCFAKTPIFLMVHPHKPMPTEVNDRGLITDVLTVPFTDDAAAEEFLSTYLEEAPVGSKGSGGDPEGIEAPLGRKSADDVGGLSDLESSSVVEQPDRPDQPHQIEGQEIEGTGRIPDITEERVESIVRKMTQEILERVVREVVPRLAEIEIRREIDRLKQEE